MGNQNCCFKKTQPLGFTDPLDRMKNHSNNIKSGTGQKIIENPASSNSITIRQNSNVNQRGFQGQMTLDKIVSPLPMRLLRFQAHLQKNYTQEQCNKYLTNTQRQWKEQLQKIKQKILNSIQKSTSIFSKKCWEYILQSLDGEYATYLDRAQILVVLDHLLRTNYKQFDQDSQDKQTEFIIDMDEIQFSIQMSEKVKKIKKRMQTRRYKLSLYTETIKNFSTYPMDFTYASTLAKKNSQLCKSDINAFAFLTLYLVICVNKRLNQSPSQIFSLIKKLQQIFNQLSIQHPPSVVDQETGEDDDKQDKISTKRISYDTHVQYPVLKFSKKDSKITRFQELRGSTISKAKQAKQDLSLFTKLIRPQVLRLGKQFKCALKIKGTLDSLPIIRTIEKISYSRHSQQFLRILESRKQQVIEDLSQCSSNKIEAFNSIWSSIIEQTHQKILDKEDSIEFSIGDLLRGKAMFKSRKQIGQTVQSIQRHIKQMNDPKYAILRTQDKLQESTKDFKMILRINETIAELQLVKQMDLASNQFNHKIYELKRSKSLTPLYSLHLLNTSLCKSFFFDQLEFFTYMLETQTQKYTSSASQICAFQREYLSSCVEYFDESEFQHHVGYMQMDMTKKIQALNKLVDDGYQSSLSKDLQDMRKQNQKEHDSYFLK